jgi:segregation and condensation protein B
MDLDLMKSRIESILFAWGEPLKLDELAKILNLKKHTVRDILNEMSQSYLCPSRGILLKQFGDTYQLKTKDSNYDQVAVLFKTNRRNSLSSSALEALSIIAYKQPVTKIEIDMIRGVKSDYILKTLLDKELIRITGKMDKPGKPSLYGTTDQFLAYFGLGSLEELPTLNIDEKLTSLEKRKDS